MCCQLDLGAGGSPRSISPILSSKASHSTGLIAVRMNLLHILINHMMQKVHRVEDPTGRGGKDVIQRKRHHHPDDHLVIERKPHLLLKRRPKFPRVPVYQRRFHPDQVSPPTQNLVQFRQIVHLQRQNLLIGHSRGFPSTEFA